MSAPLPGLPISIQVHVVDTQGNDIPPDQIPSVTVGGKGKSNATIQKVELWTTPNTGYWNGELHLFLRVS